MRTIAASSSRAAALSKFPALLGPLILVPCSYMEPWLETVVSENVKEDPRLHFPKSNPPPSPERL